MATETETGSAATGTYVYCVVPTESTAAKESTSFGEAIDATTPVRTVRDNGLTAVVSDAQRPQYDPSRANVGAHERVVREAYERGDVLPMRFGTVARDDTAVQKFLREKHEDLEKSLEQLHARAELALKVVWDREAVLREIIADNETIRDMRESLSGQPEAQTRDQRIELGRMVTEAVEKKRQETSDRILERVRQKALEVDVRNVQSDTMVLNAAFLVDRSELPAFDELVNSLGEEERGRLTFKYVGPLPPYSFVKLVVPKEE
jgi:hypothetical protein